MHFPKCMSLNEWIWSSKMASKLKLIHEQEKKLIKKLQNVKAYSFLGNHVYAEGSGEFTMMKECGVTFHQHYGQNVIDLGRIFGLYKPQELFLRKIGMEVFKGKETYKGSDKKGGADAVGTSAAAAAGGHPDNQCAICQYHFSEGENVLKESCNHVVHQNCFQGWITEMKTTCPICRQDLLKMEKVVELRQNRKI